MFQLVFAKVTLEGLIETCSSGVIATVTSAEGGPDREMDTLAVVASASSSVPDVVTTNAGAGIDKHADVLSWRKNPGEQRHAHLSPSNGLPADVQNAFAGRRVRVGVRVHATHAESADAEHGTPR
mmetsp:Transcript_39074/g.92289  ORF Transcript_39074/g.92289 Transcript_39074/m.92289 type:complete len:125 (+) Transcript_39074:594-968(+)